VLTATDGTIKLITKKQNKDFIRNVSSTFWEPGSSVCTVGRLRAGRPGVRVPEKLQQKFYLLPNDQADPWSLTASYSVSNEVLFPDKAAAE
jgi:hypothetical protein